MTITELEKSGKAFDEWWASDGSRKNYSPFLREIARIAWSNGAYKAIEERESK
jgi:hypothetical protein